jgi:AcrR family transcriptional regulator
MEPAREKDPQSLPVIWMLPDRPARGPRPAHSRGEIAAVAIKIADTGGIDAVTMRRVAAEIGCGTMSLYRYVPTKDHLFDLMIDAAAGEVEPPARPSGDWRADLRMVAQVHRAMLLRHPWLTALQAGRPSFGPNSLRALEFALSVLDLLGLTIDQMLIMVDTLIAFVRGAAVSELAEQEAQRRTGLNERQWQASLAPYVRTLMESGKYPMFNRVIADAGQPHSDAGSDYHFGVRLERVLDGLAAGLPAPPG